jgi:c-di-AMP phosphodiesterase-like protein
MVSARSIGDINVQVLMEKLGGGGHLNTAGAQLKMTMEEAEAKVREIISEEMAERSNTK